MGTGFVPKQFKIAKVVPIFKSGDKNDYNNYRPILFFSKLMEKVVARQVICFQNYHNLLYKHQYGFRENHKCSEPVLHFAEKIYNALNQKPALNALVIVIFIYLKKLLTQLATKLLRNGSLWHKGYS